jgi:hypothetical protein
LPAVDDRPADSPERTMVSDLSDNGHLFRH